MDLAEFGEHLPGHGADIVELGDIAAQADGLPVAERINFRNSGVDAGLVDIQDRNIAAEPGQVDADAFPDTAGPARDDRCLSGKVLHSQTFSPARSTPTFCGSS